MSFTSEQSHARAQAGQQHAGQRPGLGVWLCGIMTTTTRARSTKSDKATIRKTVATLLRQQKEQVRRRKSAIIWRKLVRLTAFRRAAWVCCYVALPHEVQTWGLIETMLEHGKRVAVPYVRPGSRRLGLSEVIDPGADLAPGAFGVWEPRPKARRPIRTSQLDLALVPGVAFDRKGRRLGHGLGYYDRFLARLPRSTTTVGLAYRFQVFDRLPTELHDHAVSTVLTA